MWHRIYSNQKEGLIPRSLLRGSSLRGVPKYIAQQRMACLCPEKPFTEIHDIFLRKLILSGIHDIVSLDENLIIYALDAVEGVMMPY